MYNHSIDEKNNDSLEIRSVGSKDPQLFTFDRILEPAITQEDAFEHVALPVCTDVLDGYNGTIFVYGQTGSGKTYTMFGPENDPSNPKSMGLIPRAISYIFAEIENDNSVKEARISVSFVEIYKGVQLL